MCAKRLIVALVAVVAVLTVGVAPSGAAVAPFPPGDDDIRYFVELPGVVCGPSSITTSQIVRHENIPASGVDYYLRYFDGGYVNSEFGPAPPAATGSGTINYAGFSFLGVTYPASVGMMIRIDVGGEMTYIGGTLISCASASATPVVSPVEIFRPACGVGDAPAYIDVPASNPFCDDIAWAADWGIAGGYTDGSFRPTSSVTRQAMATFLYRLADSPRGADPTCSAAAFSDVPAGHAFCGEIDWAVDEGITTGYGDGSFRPTANVTRQAMAAFLYRAADSPLGDDPPCAAAAFTDVPATHSFCGEIAWMVAEGITSGYPDSTFRPTSNVTRQAAAHFLHKAAGLF